MPPGGGTQDLKLIPSAGYEAVRVALNLNQDPNKGFVEVRFGDTTGGYGATLSAAHDPPFTINNNTPQTSNTTLAGGAGNLIFPNVVAGTTTISASPPSGKTCTPAQMVTNWRVDATTFTEVYFSCQ